MALSVKHRKKVLSKSPFVDNDFSVDEDGKTLEFYDHNLDKKVFEIYQYGDGKKIYFKKNNKRNNSRFLVI
jgi:hypothetical protein